MLLLGVLGIMRRWGQWSIDAFILLDAFWYVDILLQCQYFVVLSMVFVVLGILDILM